MRGSEAADRLPREVVLELNTSRSTCPIYWPGKHLSINRPDFSLEKAQQLFRELSLFDDIRVTLAGVGDPLLSSGWLPIIAAAKSAGIAAIGVETDLLAVSEDQLQQLATSAVDVISVHFPAASSPIYTAMMGVDGFSRVLQNMTLLEQMIKANGTGTPLIAPIFTKTAGNLAEMEVWYDYWVRRCGHAVIAGPSDFAGQMPDLAVADMASPVRRPCFRLSSRLSILSNGQIVSCEQDVLGKQVMGSTGETPIQEIWQNSFAKLRQCHQSADWASKPLCGKCREWHRA